MRDAFADAFASVAALVLSWDDFMADRRATATDRPSSTAPGHQQESRTVFDLG